MLVYNCFTITLNYFTTIFAKHSILDVWQGSEYASGSLLSTLKGVNAVGNPASGNMSQRYLKLTEQYPVQGCI